MKLKYATLALALGASVVSSTAATISATFGDLILGFYASAGTGVNRNLTVNLGSINQFDNINGANTSFSTQLNVADLISVYGSNWNTRSDLTFGFIGTTNQGANLTVEAGKVLTRGSFFASVGRASVGTQSTPLPASAQSSQANASAVITTIYTGGAESLNGKTSTTNSDFAYNADATATGSYTLQENFAPGQTFNLFPGANVIDRNTNIAGSVAVSDLYLLVPTTGGSNPTGYARGTTHLGFFTLTDAGALSFTSAIPEPSTYAALAGAAVLGFVALRRRNARQQA